MATENRQEQTVAIIGPGRLGCSLAQWAAEHGFSVRLAGRSEEHISRAASDLLGSLGGIRLFGRIDRAVDGADFVFESLPEDLALKAEIWSAIQHFSQPSALLLTGTSSLSLASIRKAASISRSIIGFHLFLPIRRMEAVEIVYEADAPESDVEAAVQLALLLEKIPAKVKDRPGFAASRLALAMGLEAMRTIESGAATPAGIDLLMKRGYGHPCGPLELSDRVGLGLRLSISRHLYAETGDPSFMPPSILEDKVAKGELGRKSGIGFYRWENGEIKE